MLRDIYNIIGTGTTLSCFDKSKFLPQHINVSVKLIAVRAMKEIFLPFVSDMKLYTVLNEVNPCAKLQGIRT